MTFHARLTELIERATKGPWTLHKVSDGQWLWGSVWATEDKESYCIVGEQFNCANAEIVAYLVNHAEATRDLVLAAEKVSQILDHPTHSVTVLDAARLREALAKLNGGKHEG